MKTSRRNLLLASLGAAQLALLGRFGLRSAVAAPKPTGPTKLLCIWLDGGCNWEHIFSPFTASGIDKFIRPPEGGNHPFGYSKEQVRTFDGTKADLSDPGMARKLRGPVYWNDADPADTSNPNPLSGGSQIYRPWGYSWVDPRLQALRAHVRPRRRRSGHRGALQRYRRQHERRRRLDLPRALGAGRDCHITWRPSSPIAPCPTRAWAVCLRPPAACRRW